MKKLINISKWLQMLVLLTFFLPFFPPGCEQSKKAEEAPVALCVDSTNGSGQSISQDKITVKSKKSSSMGNADNNEAISERLSKKSVVLKFLLRPNDNYTGIGYTLDVFESFFGFGISMALILLLIGLIIKIKDYNLIFQFINFGAFILLFFSRPAMFTDSKLWGFWVCLALVSCTLIYDTVVLMLSWKKRLEN